jgi:hypothetical protein
MYALCNEAMKIVPYKTIKIELNTGETLTCKKAIVISKKAKLTKTSYTYQFLKYKEQVSFVIIHHPIVVLLV